MADAEKEVKRKHEHPEMREVKFSCATCGASFTILSTLNKEHVGVDVCSGCHPVYVGNYGQKKVRGRAEKLAHRFVNEETKVPKKSHGFWPFRRSNKQSKKSKSFSEL